MQHSLVGESAVNGMIENMIQRVQGQARAIKLDLEAGVRINPRFPIWNRLVEFAAQTILMWRISGDDGVTAIQRIRGRSSTTPKARFGEKMLFKVARTVRLGKAEARWREGIWLGTVESSDEHLVGTMVGVIKRRCSAGVADNFDAKAIEETR